MNRGRKGKFGMRRRLAWLAVPGLAIAVVAFGGIRAQDASVELRVGARNLEGGRVELALQGRDASGAWGEQVLPAGRVLPAGASGWKHSTAVEVGGLEARAAVRWVERGARLALQVRDDAGGWSERRHPRARVLPRNAAGWRYSSALSVALPSGAEEAAESELAGAARSSADAGAAAPAVGGSASSGDAAGAGGAPNGGGSDGTSSGAADAAGAADAGGGGESGSGDGTDGTTVNAASSGAVAGSDSAAGDSGAAGEVGTGNGDSEPEEERISGATDAEALAAGWFVDVRVGVRTGADGSSSFQLHVRGPWGTWRVQEMGGRLPADAGGWRVTREIGVSPVDARTCLSGLGSGTVRIAALNERGGVRVAVQAYRHRSGNWLERVEPEVQIAERREGGHLTSTVRLALPAPGPAEQAPGAGEMVSEEDGGPVSDGRSRTPSECYQPREWPPVATARIESLRGWALAIGELLWSGKWESGTNETLYLRRGAEGWQYSWWSSVGALFPDTRERPWNTFVRVAWRLVDDERRVEAALQPWVAPGRWGELIEPFETFEISWDGEGADQFGDPVALPVPEELPWPPAGWME